MRRTLMAIGMMALVGPAMAAEAAWDKYGADVPAGEVVPLAQALANPAAHEGQAKVFSGRVVDVCQKKGCWVMLEDDGQGARVLLGDHDFYVPKDVRGQAQVHGVLSRVALSPDARQHTAKETSGAPVPAVEYRIVADGVQVLADDPGA
ncbi:DUF4920 domain-containing protein [Pseudoxanthomonas sp. PXM02]|uniref:DUF4920 domain-containing protein n=1 Tax=Pseudoxanthomonas sp. PXM02 TaxID=2769294 RepID=UPI00177E4DF9|nr:DUF4920 domain-containing protein [Pseudoxanthomonas sp. PXM02]MBD9479210.1 DUF4920 domain-containing protein [Pseudoxanthomonas sp. PXM02]